MRALLLAQEFFLLGLRVSWLKLTLHKYLILLSFYFRKLSHASTAGTLNEANAQP